MSNKHFTYLLILAMFFWGGGWSALKIIVEELPPQTIIFWRFFIMSVAFLPILYFIKKPLALNKKSISYILASSVLNIGFMLSSFFGVKYGLAGAGSVIITTFSPIMTFLLVAIIFRKNLSLVQYIGLFLGLVGGAILLELHDFELFLNGSNIYFLLCAVLWAGVTILSQHSHKHIHPVHYSFYISLIATLVSFIYAYDANLLAVFDQDSRFWIALLYLAIFGQTVATTIYFIASGKLGSQKSSSFMFLVPLFALFSAWLILDEPIELHIVVGGFISMVAVVLINHKTDDKTT
jgi:drug/metabolite transporter (DMT)-like permease